MNEIQEFFVAGQNKSTQHFLLNTGNIDSELLEESTYFMFAEIKNSKREDLKFIQTIFKEIKISFSLSAQNETRAILETAIKYVNNTHKDELNNLPQKLTMMIGILNKNSLSFCYLGNPEIGVIDNNGKYQSVLNEETKDSSKLFPSIFEGKTPKNKLFLLTTKNTFSIIHKRFDTLPLQSKILSITESLEAIIKRENSTDFFGGIIIRNVIQTQGVARKITRDLSDYSGYALSPVTKRKINIKKLKPNYQYQNKPILSNTVNRVLSPHLDRTFKQILAQESFFNRVLILFGKTISFFFQSCLSFLSYVWKKIVSAILLITNRGGYRKLVLQSINDDIFHKKKEIRDLSTRSKVIFICAMVFTISLTGGLTVSRIKKNDATLMKVYENSFARISTEIKKVENLVLVDKTMALKTLEMLEQDIISLDEKNIYKIDLLNLFQETQSNIYNITETIGSIFYDFSLTYPDFKPTNIILIGDKLLIYAVGGHTIFSIDRDTISVTPITLESSLKFISATKAEEDVIFSIEGGNLAIFHPRNNTFELIDFEVRRKAITNDIFYYNDKLYSLDLEKKQIYKHNKTQTGYDRGTEWLSTSYDHFIENSGILVDGNIYAYTPEGQLQKFFRGKIDTDFKLYDLEPILTNIKDVYISEKKPFIYILDDKEKRIITLTKQGRFVSQHTSSVWGTSNAITVDEDKDIVYTISESAIHTFLLK